MRDSGTDYAVLQSSVRSGIEIVFLNNMIYVLHRLQEGRNCSEDINRDS